MSVDPASLEGVEFFELLGGEDRLALAEVVDLVSLGEGPRTATAVALSEAELIELDRDDLLLLFRRKPDAALHMLAAMGRMTRKADALLRTRVSRNVNEEVEVRATLFQRVADGLAWFSGSMFFLLIHAVWFGAWI